MSREVIIKSNDNILNEARKTKFMLDYHNWIESKVNAIDNHLHVRTTNSRHKKRDTDKDKYSRGVIRRHARGGVRD